MDWIKRVWGDTPAWRAASGQPQWPLEEQTVIAYLKAMYDYGCGYPSKIQVDGKVYDLPLYNLGAVPEEIRDAPLDGVMVSGDLI